MFPPPLPNSVPSDGDIYFPSSYDTSYGGHAALCVGYDDRRRILSEKGTLLIQSSWGKSWGDSGFGWLPYRYVVQQLAVDFWLLLKPKWLSNGEFSRPL